MSTRVRFAYGSDKYGWAFGATALQQLERDGLIRGVLDPNGLRDPLRPQSRVASAVACYQALLKVAKQPKKLLIWRTPRRVRVAEYKQHMHRWMGKPERLIPAREGAKLKFVAPKPKKAARPQVRNERGQVFDWAAGLWRDPQVGEI